MSPQVCVCVGGGFQMFNFMKGKVKKKKHVQKSKMYSTTISEGLWFKGNMTVTQSICAAAS